MLKGAFTKHSRAVRPLPTPPKCKQLANMTEAVPTLSQTEDDESPTGMSVFVRIRPLSSSEVKKGNKVVVVPFCEDKIVRITKLGRKGAVLSSEKGCMHEYMFDNVFGPMCSQQEVYENTTKALVEHAVAGTNCTVFAYGATGSGKTHTMLGSVDDDNAGIIPRAAKDVFRCIKKLEAGMSTNKEKKAEYSVRISYLEVYNETIYDLLAPTQKMRQRGLLPCEDPHDNTVKVLGLTEAEVGSEDEVMKYLRLGNSRRRMESTAANQFSSRSHAVLQVLIEKTTNRYTRLSMQPLRPGRLPRKDDDSRFKRKRIVTKSRLSMIDLAGSERAAATQNRGQRLREGANINKSLLALANCINALSSRKTKTNGNKRGYVRVKYRDSKLTHLLKSSLEGNCKVAMITAINPANKVYEESHNSLKYADRAKSIKIPSVKTQDAEVYKKGLNGEGETDDRLMILEAENQELRTQLSRASICPGTANLTSPLYVVEDTTSQKKRRVSREPGSWKAEFEQTSSDFLPATKIQKDQNHEYESLILQNQSLAAFACNSMKRYEGIITAENISELVKNAVVEVLGMDAAERERIVKIAQEKSKSRIQQQNILTSQSSRSVNSRRQSHIQPPTRRSRRNRRAKGANSAVKSARKKPLSIPPYISESSKSQRRSPAIVRAMEYASHRLKGSPRSKANLGEDFNKLQTGVPIMTENKSGPGKSRLQKSFVGRKMASYLP